MAIKLLSVPDLLMQGVQAQYKNNLRKPNFLRSFFKSSTTAAITVSHEAKRKSEIIAKDRERNAGSQLFRTDKSTLKQFKTPFYSLEMPITELDMYDRMFGSADTVSEEMLDDMVLEVNERVGDMQQVIERAYEKQAADALFNRYLTFEELDDIDYRKKAESSIAAGAVGNGGVWSDPASNPLTAIIKQCQFITGVGSGEGGIFNGLGSATVMEQLISNEEVKERADIRRMELVDIKVPEYANKTGAVYYGTIVAGAYRIHLWGYDQQFVDAGTRQGYIPESKFLLFPMQIDLRMRYAGVAHKDPRTGLFLPKKGDWHVRMLNDETHQVSSIQVASSGLAVPFEVDQLADIRTEDS